jgi:hypothetical protein
MIRRLCTGFACLVFCAVFFQARAYSEEPGDDGRVQLLIRANPNGAAKLSFRWKQLEGPNVTIENPTASKFENGKWVSETYFVATEPGKYTFEITVTNEDGVESKGKVVREVLPPTPPPVAVAGKDQSDKLVGETVRINGVGSKAAEGRSITEWQWKLIDSPEKFKGIDPKLLKERSFDFKADQPGTYQFELRVNDGKRWSAPSQMQVTVKLDSKPPKIDEVVEPVKKVELPAPPKIVEVKKPEVKVVVQAGKSLKLGDTLVLDGSQSVIDETTKPEFYWRSEKGFVRDLAAEKSKPFSKSRSDVMNYPVWTCKPKEAGEYSFVLEVTTYDSKGQPTRAESTPVTFTVVAPEPEKVVEKKDPPKVDTPATTVDPDKVAKVNPPKDPFKDPPPVKDPPKNPPPVAKIFAERTTVEVGETVKLDGSKSKDPADGKLEFLWGPVPGKRAPKSWAGKEGPKVEFIAEEEGEYAVALMVKAGDLFSEPAQITISVGAANQPPKIKMAKSIEGLIGEQIRIEPEVSDPENDRVTYKWESVDPPNLQMRDQNGKDMSVNPSLVFVPARAGAYDFKVTVTDARGAADSAQVHISVKERINRPPVAIIKGAKAVAVGTKVKLNGGDSTDPERKPLTYLWSQDKDGPRIPGDVPGEKSKTWEFTPTEPGRYMISLVVSDGVNKSDPDLFELTVSVNNTPPVAAISGPAGGRVTIGETITLDGAPSSDPDGDKLTYKWKRGEGKGGVELGALDQDKLTVKAVTGGPVRIELVVNDGKADSEPGHIDLIVGRPNNKPVAKITGPDSAKLGGFVDLSAAESSDPDGDEVTYVWSQPSEGGGPEIGVRGKELRKKTLRFRADKPGTYVVNLEVVDSEGAKSEPVTHKIDVKGANRPPKAVAARVGADPVVAGGEVKLSARGSLDPEGAPLKYKWKQLAGEPVTAAEDNAEILNLVVKNGGNYEWELVVSDGENDSPPAHVAFFVRGPNNPPVAVINDVVSGEIGERITLDGSASRDADNDKLEYKWTQVSGPEAKFAWRGQTKAKTEVVLQKDEEHVFELKVFDGKEWSAPRQVTLRPRSANIPPVAAVATAELRTEESIETVLDASASTDPDKGPRALSYIWRQTGGPARVELHSEGAIARFIAKRAGAYSFDCRVSDGKNESAPAAVHVEVLKAGSLPVAVAIAEPNPVKAAQKGNRDDPNILILDGTKSHGSNGALSYLWKQIGGDDLKLRAPELSKKRVGMRIFVPGMYRFMLTVTDGQNSSTPAYVDVKVVDAAGNIPEDKPKASGNEAPAPAPAPKPEKTEKKSTERKEPADKPAPEPKEPRTENTGKAPSVEEGLILPPPKDSKNGAETSDKQKALNDLSAKIDPEAERQLVSALSSNDAESRSSAAAALVRRGVNSIPALIGVLENGDKPAKNEAAWALRELTHETLGQDAAKWKQWWAQQPAAKNAPVTDK